MRRKAAALLEAARAIHHDIGSFEHGTGCIEELADLASIRGDVPEADGLYGRAVAIYRRLDRPADEERVGRKRRQQG